jgi:hypothetical protein
MGLEGIKGEIVRLLQDADRHKDGWNIFRKKEVYEAPDGRENTVGIWGM